MGRCIFYIAKCAYLYLYRNVIYSASIAGFFPVTHLAGRFICRYRYFLLSLPENITSDQ